ncbi:MAG: zinc ABC transporter solute-binding protein [Bacteroidales bacterium]|nr:zinc ABC transporter solute-binding protein [Bacteroidales bacterium]OQB61634.1 MAG: putative periplasmic iron-binding protein precursor [Bacteroidetes bacterium ADurb.Bin145]
MKRIIILLSLASLFSCNLNPSGKRERIITVSIAPFKYFVEAIAGDDFRVNVMVPAGSNPHIYEPVPDQINKLRLSEAYIGDGYLGFELTWLGRFYEINKQMIKLSIGEKIDLIAAGHDHHGEHTEGADPHYWVSPRCAKVIASSVYELLSGLNPGSEAEYKLRYSVLLDKIDAADKQAVSFFSDFKDKAFMIYHPNLAYLARDYGLKEIPVEYEGKEPPPSRMKELIDIARKENIRVIFVQKEYDNKNARVIAHEIGAELKIIDPLSEDWMAATTDIITSLHDSFLSSKK